MGAIGFGPRFAVARRVRVALAGAPVSPVFDFDGGMLPGGASFARASPATTLDGGTLTGVGPDVPRLGAGGLLIEPVGSNRLPRSSDWGDPSWSYKFAGGGGGVLVEDATAGAVHQVRQTSGALAYTAGQVVTMSVVARSRAGPAKRYLVLYLGAAPVFAGPCGALFDPATGTVTGSTNATAAGTTALGDGAWLCWFTATAVASGTAQVAAVKLSDSATLDHAYTGDGASGVNATHVQIEPGGTASSRILTTGAAATRAADLVTLDWRGRGVADGPITVRYTFDDGSVQDMATTVADGRATVPTTLLRRRLRRAERR